MDCQNYLDVHPSVIHQMFFFGGFIRLAEIRGTHEGEVGAFRKTVADYEEYTARALELEQAVRRGTATAEQHEDYRMLCEARSNRLKTALSLGQPVYEAYKHLLVLPYTNNVTSRH